MDIHTSPERTVERAVIEADRRRRRVSACRAVAVVAPSVAATALAVSVVGHGLGWRTTPLVATLACLALGVVAFFLWTDRSRVVVDGTVAQIDQDAELGGELRSATWFSAQATGDQWTVFHLERAAQRVADVDWLRVYPARRSPAAWWLTAALSVLAVLVTTRSARTAPAWSPRQLAPEASTSRLDAPQSSALPEDIQANLAALLASTALSEADSQLLVDAAARLEALAARDPALRDTLDRILKARAQQTQADPRTPATSDLNGLIGAAEQALSLEEKWALDDLLARMARAEGKQSESEAGEKAEDAGDADLADEAPDGAAPSQRGQSSTPGGAPSAGRGGASVQQMREAVGAGGAQAFLGITGASAGSGPMTLSRLTGQARGAIKAAPIEVASALLREVVESGADLRGANVKSANGQDPRRQGQQDASRLDYTGVALRTSDRARADLPPQVPEARRPQLERYFVRPPTPN